MHSLFLIFEKMIFALFYLKARILHILFLNHHNIGILFNICAGLAFYQNLNEKQLLRIGRNNLWWIGINQRFLSKFKGIVFASIVYPHTYRYIKQFVKSEKKKNSGPLLLTLLHFPSYFLVLALIVRASLELDQPITILANDHIAKKVKAYINQFRYKKVSRKIKDRYFNEGLCSILSFQNRSEFKEILKRMKSSTLLIFLPDLPISIQTQTLNIDFDTFSFSSWNGIFRLAEKNNVPISLISHGMSWHGIKLCIDKPKNIQRHCSVSDNSQMSEISIIGWIKHNIKNNAVQWLCWQRINNQTAKTSLTLDKSITLIKKKKRYCVNLASREVKIKTIK